MRDMRPPVGKYRGQALLAPIEYNSAEADNIISFAPRRGHVGRGEEALRQDLGGLAARRRAIGAEIGPVLRVARLARPAASIAADGAMLRSALHPQPEGVADRDIGESLPRGRHRIEEAGGLGHDL